MAIVGMSLHTVQDFYAHTSWVETAGEFGSPDGPGWSADYGSFPTYFDIPKKARDTRAVYSAVNGVSRPHGKWQTDGNDSHAHGMNKDWPARPLYEKAYVTAYFASRQWIRAARGWLGDDALWARAQRLAAPAGLKADLRASLDISKYSGHWQGNGQPCAKAIVFCGDLYGWAGSVLGLRSAIKTYHEDHPQVAGAQAVRGLRVATSTSSMAPSGSPSRRPAATCSSARGSSSSRCRACAATTGRWATPGPDDADLYVNARIRGQHFDSPVIHDHDRFGFPKPYGPFTWIRSVPVGWRASTPVSTLTVRVKTGNRRFAGTDDDVYLRVNNGLRFDLDKRAYNDFERGDDDTYAVPLDVVTRAGLSVKDITIAQIEKSRDGARRRLVPAVLLRPPQRPGGRVEGGQQVAGGRPPHRQCQHRPATTARATSCRSGCRSRRTTTSTASTTTATSTPSTATRPSRSATCPAPRSRARTRAAIGSPAA